MQKLLSSTFILFGLFGFVLFAHAQATGAQFSTVQFQISPEIPGPNEAVTITAQGVGGFLGDAAITWQQDGKTILSGVGRQAATFFTGAVGKTTAIHVSIVSPTLGTFTKDFSFTPSSIHLLWEADTSVPPMYRGKALYSAGSRIKVVALPQVVSNGSYVSANRLSYRWSVGDEPSVADSGLGRSTFTYYGNQLNQNEAVSVDVYFGSTQVGHADLALPITEPGMLLYVQDPLRGTLFDQALPASLSLVGQETTIRAWPLYFANESIGNTLTYTWSLNGQPVTGPNTDRGIITLRQTGSGGGQSLLTLDLQNTDENKLFQAASTKIGIIFGQQPSAAASGFGI